VRRLDARSGTVLWSLDLRRETGREDAAIVAGFPSAVPVDKRVVIVLRFGEVWSVDLSTGRVLAKGRTPHPGIHLVTRNSVLFLSRFGLSEFDHRSMFEREWSEHAQDVAPLYGKETANPCAFWLTTDSLIWTDLNGILVGISRKKDRVGNRTIWNDHHRGALVPIADFPLAYGDHLYFADKGENLGLHCYRSVARRTSAKPAARSR
jgi:outer membrane protein assembly factor BamB